MVGAGKSKGGKGKGPGEAHAMQSGWTAWTAWTAYAAYEQSKAKGKGKADAGKGMGKGMATGTKGSAGKGKGKGKALVKGKAKADAGPSKGKISMSGQPAKGKGKPATSRALAKGRGKGKGGGKATMPQTGASLGKGGKPALAKGKGKGQGGSSGPWPKAKSQGKGQGTGESTKRVPRLAAEIAGAIGDLVEGKFTQDDFWEVFEKFCWDKGYPSSGFATVWFLLQRWRVIGRANKDKFKLLSLTQSNFKTRTPTDALGALDGTRPKLLAQELASPVPEYPLPQKLQALTAMDVYKMQAAVLKLLESEGMKPGQMERCYQDPGASACNFLSTPAASRSHN